MRKLLLRGLGVLVIVLLVGAGGTFFWVRRQLTSSLPSLDGEVRCTDLGAPARIERDESGVPTIRAGNRTDLAYATGYAHAQDRFFQMDLLRRSAAGELAALFGGGLVEMDKSRRLYHLRHRARKVHEQTDASDHAIVEAYAKGANAGLASLGNKPFEYVVLGTEPEPWRPEDTVLAGFAMYLTLQGDDWETELARAVVKDTLGEEMYRFLLPVGNEWDAPLDETKFAQPEPPGPEVFSLRKTDLAWIDRLRSLDRARFELEEFQVGSNNWAVAGSHTKHGGALLANDMHLHIGVPNIWYRATLSYPAEAGGAAGEHALTGVTLPGTPVLVVGSNRHVAWGFTNSEGDWVDVVVVEVDPDNKDQYKTPEGMKRFEKHAEVIKVRGGADETVEVVETIWGPVARRDHRDRPVAIHWVALEPGGLNFGLDRVGTARTLEEAMASANASGSAAQNFVVADKNGNIGWTILGRIPRRQGFDGYLPTSWANAGTGWNGFLEPAEYPRIVNPPSGRIWTANARVVGGQMLDKLGIGGYDLGARAGQIRDDLMAIEKADEADMLKVQLDDRAPFYARWQRHLLEVLTPEAVQSDPRRAELRRHVESWGERAAIDSVGFRMVLEYRQELTSQILGAVTAACLKADPRFRVRQIKRSEGPVWKIVSTRPEHFLPRKYATWDEQFLAAVDSVLDQALATNRTWADLTWGKANTTRIQHPLSIGIPGLGQMLGLDMPPRPLPGGPANMPRIQRPDSGASERLAVSPGREDKGYYHMATGQSGHPYSPHYSDGHKAWEEGIATPFLPGKPAHTLTLEPVGLGKKG